MAAGGRGVPSPEMWRRFRRNRLATVGLAIILVEVAAAVLAPVITFADPGRVDPAASLSSPSADHWFGTDLLGRDLYSRVVYGARVSLQVGIVAVLIALAIGLVAGAAAGWFGGFVDGLVMRVTDVFLAFPYVLAAIAVITAVGRGKTAVTVVLGLLGWMPIARLIRSSVLQAKQTDYVEAARAVGAADLRILVGHVLPNAVQPVVVFAAMFVGTAVLSEAALSFLGAGITEPTAAWGLMMAQGKDFLFTAPHLLFFPGAAVFLTVMAFVFVGDGLRDALDPRVAVR
ncbi:MAG TPA: ABC transporter permease [Acidimicrobiales bacterium]|nr:ABC transporter permease [Acidimicrobiales bacterium]